MADELDDVLNEFIIESYENLDRELVTLEQEATADSLASVFRAIHTIKVTSGFFGFEKLESVAHVGENLLSRLRDGHFPVTQEIVSALLSMVDAIREVITSIESGTGEGDADYSSLVATLGQLERGETAAPAEVDTADSIGTDPVEASHPTPAIEATPAYPANADDHADTADDQADTADDQADAADDHADTADDLHDRLRSDGFLMLGSSETAVGIDTRYDRHQAGKTVLFRPLSADRVPLSVR